MPRFLYCTKRRTPGHAFYKAWMGVALGVLLLFAAVPVALADPLQKSFTSKGEPSKPLTASALPQVVRETMRAYFQPGNDTPSVEQLAKNYTLSKELESPAGVFVTLSHNGKSRACWGSVFPEHRNMVQATVDATLGALSREYRYPPIRAHEWPALTPQVTLIRRIVPASGIQGINPLREGLMVRSGSKSGVILPGEYGDAHTQLVQGKLKAGIQPGEPYQLYRIQADVFQ